MNGSGAISKRHALISGDSPIISGTLSDQRQGLAESTLIFVLSLLKSMAVQTAKFIKPNLNIFDCSFWKSVRERLKLQKQCTQTSTLEFAYKQWIRELAERDFVRSLLGTVLV